MYTHTYMTSWSCCGSRAWQSCVYVWMDACTTQYYNIALPFTIIDNTAPHASPAFNRVTVAPHNSQQPQPTETPFAFHAWRASACLKSNGAGTWWGEQQQHARSKTHTPTRQQTQKTQTHTTRAQTGEKSALLLPLFQVSLRRYRTVPGDNASEWRKCRKWREMKVVVLDTHSVPVLY